MEGADRRLLRRRRRRSLADPTCRAELRGPLACQRQGRGHRLRLVHRRCPVPGGSGALAGVVAARGGLGRPLVDRRGGGELRVAEERPLHRGRGLRGPLGPPRQGPDAEVLGGKAPGRGEKLRRLPGDELGQRALAVGRRARRRQILAAQQRLLRRRRRGCRRLRRPRLLRHHGGGGGLFNCYVRDRHPHVDHLARLDSRCLVSGGHLHPSGAIVQRESQPVAARNQFLRLLLWP
mmetsp:Transcript_120201/g.347366  ORF Transcript_120201/g.347366 Transcript_120201/m.347366 type:complete len:235 (-) Transcript_120201:220-924(-)